MPVRGPRWRRLPAATAAAAVVAATIAGCVFGARWDGPVSDHFDGERFLTPAPFDVGLLDLIRYRRESEPGPWTRDLALAPGPAPRARVGAGELVLTFVNHATVLVQADGVNVLTDPIWSERASPVSWAGPRRYRPPGLAFETLPPIDAVVVSHNHYDHFDLPTLDRLEARDAPLFVVPPGDGARLRARGYGRVVELDWWQQARLANGCAITALPTQHWSSRGLPGDRNRSFWLAYAIGTRDGPVYFAGDTGYGPHFVATRQRLGPIRAALLPIGAYRPRWLTAYQHVDPAEAVQAHRDLASPLSLGIHYGTFRLADDGQTEPVTTLAQALAEQGLAADAFRAAEFGAAVVVPAAPLATETCSP